MGLASVVRQVLDRFAGDRFYLQCQYWQRNRAWLNLRSPKKITEKIQWLKLYYRRSDLPMLVNKHDCRAYVASRIGSEHLPKLLAKYDKAEDIDWDALPKKFVIKAAHGAAMVILCKDKAKLDKAEVTEKLRYWQSIESPCVTRFREWAYTGGNRAIIVEEFLENEQGNPPEDFKIFCFHGEPKFIQVDFARFEDHARLFYDLDWKPLPFEWKIPAREENFPKPRHLDKMLEIARKLSKDLPFARIDLYEVGDRVLFGEITLYPGAGYGTYVPAHFDEHVGDMLTLPEPISA